MTRKNFTDRTVDQDLEPHCRLSMVVTSSDSDPWITRGRRELPVRLPQREIDPFEKLSSGPQRLEAQQTDRKLSQGLRIRTSVKEVQRRKVGKPK